MISKGLAYERIAEQYLSKKGLKPQKRNYHTQKGEIDLIMQDSDTIVFVEVRYRKNSLFGSAEETVTKCKQTKIIYSAKHYLTKFQLWHMAARFDVVTIKPKYQDQLEINWLKNAFD